MQRQRALKRLRRDLIELERADLNSIAAKPLARNLFEWHVNIKPIEGVYSGVYLHLILTFPESYPVNPPKGIRSAYIRAFSDRPFKSTHHRMLCVLAFIQ